MTAVYDGVEVPMAGPVARASKCLGCVDPILALPHMCGGARIPSAELGWRCVCPQPECRRRQQGIALAGDKPRNP